MAGLDPKHNSRALTEGLSAQQTQEQFDKALDESIESIYQASST